MQHMQEQATPARKLQVARRKLQQRERAASPRAAKDDSVSAVLQALREARAERDDLKLELGREVKRRVLLGDQLEREREERVLARGEMEDLLNREKEKIRIAEKQAGVLEKAIMVLARSREEKS